MAQAPARVDHIGPRKQPMMTDDTAHLLVPIAICAGRLSTLDLLADIPEEEIWLQNQKSAHTRRAYRLDVQHFMRTLAITTSAADCAMPTTKR